MPASDSSPIVIEYASRGKATQPGTWVEAGELLHQVLGDLSSTLCTNKYSSWKYTRLFAA